MPNEHRLSTDVRPRAYRLVLAPDLDALTYKGEVAIDVDVRAATGEIVLNAVELKIEGATIGGAPVDVKLDDARERLVLTPKQPVAPGAATVAIRFSAPLSEKMRGFYRSSYTRRDGTQAVLATTQFEATSARRAFPCFDEPAFKAAFDVTIVVPAGRTAVSNMPVASDEPAAGGARRVRFAPTPVMSTYLLAFAVGEFDCIEARTKDGVPVRVFATPGKAELGRFALETAVRGLEFFDTYYGIPYKSALPKVDLLAIPDFEAGAMENWGAITFRETAIFVDPKRSSVPQRRRVAEVVLHELAHQWFGNLVSPEWWSYLWLNESFATFMAFKAADVLFPEWKVFEEYLAVTTSGGVSLDSLRSSHPVEVPVGDPSEVDQIFDAISYNKGGSVLRMLEQSIGEDAFRDGIRRYLKRHTYACATTDDLWRALGEQTGRDVQKMMDGWTRQTGLPVVHARRDGGKLALRQERFLLDRDPERPSDDPTLWDVPVPLVDKDGRRSAARLSSREGTVDAALKLNAGQCGFYLVNYDDAGWQALAASLGTLPPADRFGVQEDAYSLMRAGFLSVPAYLRLVGAYASEENHHVWSGLARGLRALAEIFVGDPSVPRLEELARKLHRPIVEKVGWAEKADEGHDRLLLRPAVLGAAVHFGDPAVVEEAKRRFEAARRDMASLLPNLQGLVFSGAARHGGDEVLDALIAMYEGVDLPEVKVRLLQSMGAFRREAPLRRAVAYALSDKVRPQDAFYVLAGVPVESKPHAWALVKEHWEVLDRRYGKSGMIGHVVMYGASGIPTEAHAQDVEAFFKSHPAPYATAKIKQLLEGVRARAKFRARNAAAFAKSFS